MPIGDLLASITGGTNPAVPSRPNQAPKRKADDDARNPAAKIPRITPPANQSSVPSTRSETPTTSIARSSISRPQNQSYSDAARRSNTTNGPRSLATARSRSTQGQRPQPSSSSVPASAPKPVQIVRSQLPVNNSSATPKPAPKKGSFAEIMARAAKAQQTNTQVGKIQHKPLEKIPSKRERAEMMKAESARASKIGVNVNGRSGATALGPRGTAGQATGSGVPGSRAPVNGKKEAEPAEIKKPKKAAVATTGYQGTARPRTGVPPKNRSSSATTGTVSRAPRVLGGGLRDRQRRRDDYYEDDEEMDDFIDDDEDEPEEVSFGGRYRYASEEDESDMEAGLSDIDEEERTAEVLGRREDREQDALEQKLKREKEERKRRLLQVAASKRR